METCSLVTLFNIGHAVVVIYTCVQDKLCSSIIFWIGRDDATISPNKLSRFETNPEYNLVRVNAQYGSPAYWLLRGALGNSPNCVVSSRQWVHWSCMPSGDSNTMNEAWSSTASQCLHQTAFWCTDMYRWHGPCAHCIRISDFPESGLSLGESLSSTNWVRLYTTWCKDSSTALVVSEMSRGFPWTTVRSTPVLA